LALLPSKVGEERKPTGRNHSRLSAVVSIGVIVALAIVCVVVAVFGSAQRADEVALDTERQLFTRALTNHGDRVRREIEAVATSEAAYRKIRVSFDSEWVQVYVGLRLQSFFDHDFVFIADSSDRFLYASFGNRSVDPNWFNSVRPELKPALDLLRDRGASDNIASPGQHRRIARLQKFLGRPAILAGVTVVARGEAPVDSDAEVPAVLSVKFIDETVLAEIASRLQLRNLRRLEPPASAGDYVFDLKD
jgi:sensor domain CHASE-containing protein